IRGNRELVQPSAGPPEISSLTEKDHWRRAGRSSGREFTPSAPLAFMRAHSPADKRESGSTVHAGRHVVLWVGHHEADTEGIAGSVEHLIDDRYRRNMHGPGRLARADFGVHALLDHR